MTYSPLNINVYTAAYAGAVAGCGIPTGAFITDPVSNDYGPNISVAVAFAQAVDTAWGASPANTYDIEAITDAADNLFARGPGCPIGGVIVTQANWTIVATALVALIRKGDSVATAGGIVFPFGGVAPSFTITQELWVAASWGSDTTGDGSIFNPFQTIAHAQSVITDASGSKLYEIILYPGQYTENIAIKAFTKIVGFDPTQSVLNSTYPAELSGNISLGTSFATTTAIAWITNCEISGLNVHIDFVAAGTTVTGPLSFTNCQFDTDMAINMNDNHVFELHGCTTNGSYLQTGGGAIWEDVAGDNVGGSITVRAATTGGATLQMYNSTWIGAVNADQHGNSTAGQLVQIEMYNSQARVGGCVLTASGSNVPTIDASYGDLTENIVLAGSASVKLGYQMRVSKALSVPAGTVLAPFATTDVVIPLTSDAFGAASIEQASCTFTANGSAWKTRLATQNCIWSIYVVQNGATAEVHVAIFSYNDSPLTLTANLPLTLYAFLPNQIV